MKKPIKCPDCNSICIEIGKPHYPKGIYEPGISKIYHEYRYACLKCEKEWLHDTYTKIIEDIVSDSEYFFDFKTKGFKKW